MPSRSLPSNYSLQTKPLPKGKNGKISVQEMNEYFNKD